MTTAEPRILVVDDDRLMLALLAGVLRNEGYHHVDKASSGKEALEKCRMAAFDIIFLDVEMPDMNGIETLQVIRQEGFPSQVVLVSANPLSHYVMAARENHAAGFVVKPLSPRIVSDTIANCMKHLHPDGEGAHAHK
jgi:CheY-like chemotaxis protein